MTEWNYEEWAEKTSLENLKHRIATGDVMLAQANGLLSVLLIGMGGAISYGIKVFEPGPVAPSVWGAVAVAVWLMWIGIVLVFECIATRNTDVPGNEPDNIYQPEENPEGKGARKFELGSMQRRINSTKARNSAVAWWLDGCRYAALATPLVFLICTLVAAN